MFRRSLYRLFRTLYRISRWVSSRLTSAGMIIAGGALGATIFGLDIRQTLAYQVAAVFISLLLLAALWSLRFRAPLKLQRRLPRYASIGVPCTYEVFIENPGGRIERDLQIIDVLDRSLPDFESFQTEAEPQGRKRNWFDRVVGYPRWVNSIRRRRGADCKAEEIPHLAAGETLALRLQITPVRRGYLHFESMRLLRPDPLGLVLAQASVPAADSLLVLPERFPVSLPRENGRRRYQPGGESLASAVGDSQEFASLRDYRPGDPLRHVHWRSWARTGKPVVKEYMDEFFDRNALVLDNAHGAADAQCFEAAVSIAASFADAPWGSDALLDLMFLAGRANRLTAGRALAEPVQMLEALACVQSGSGRFEDLVGLVRRQLTSLSNLILVLTDWNEVHHQLIREIQANNVPVRVFLVSRSEHDAGPMQMHAERWHVLAPEQVRESLAKLSSDPGKPAEAA